jgi:aminopeptidase-like protein
MIFGERARLLLAELFPICRSLTGDGNRNSFNILKQIIPLETLEVPSGSKVYDWTVPDEWNIRDAYIADSTGARVVSFKENNLSVVSCSEPIDKTMSFAELAPRLHTLADLPNAIPYRTSYFKRDWGFCLTQERFDQLDKKENYRVVIDSTLDPKGSMTLGHAFHQGKFDREILISSYICHPSMANDNLSGVVLSTLLFDWIRKQKTNYSYRLVIVPETLGVICYLNQFEEQMKKRIVGGTVVTTCGGPGPLGLKPTFQQEHWLDQMARSVLKNTGEEWKDFPFVPDGSDERQYASPGFRIPTVSITKDKYYTYKEYHTSLDDLNFVKSENLEKTFNAYCQWFEMVDANLVFERKNQECEYQLGKRGLYPETGGAFRQDSGEEEVLNIDALSWLMFGCDGKTDLWSLSLGSGISIKTLLANAEKMEEAGLVTCRSH